jgi:hypothetical protein
MYIMSRGRDKVNLHHKQSSSSSSDSDEIFINIKHKKRDSSTDSSSSSSSSTIERYSNDKCKRKDKDCREKKHSKKHKKDCKSSSDSECEDKCSFEDIYKYYKFRLLHDKQLMVAGSDAYINSESQTPAVIPRAYPVEMEETSLAYNIDHAYNGSPFYVRESGVYIFFLVVNSEQSAQLSVFVNGVEQPLTRSGNNSGAGQLVLRNMMKLKKDDALIIRNSESESNAIESNVYNGGLQKGNDVNFLLMKIAPYDTCELHDWNEECLSKRKRYLFKKLLDKMLLDKDLMLKGFNVRGTFYNTLAQDVLTENDVVFNANQVVNGLAWDPLAPSEVKILEDGVYKLFFLVNTNTAAQFALAVNGTPVPYTVQGTNRGAAQLTIRALLELNKNDIVTVKNHTSANGKVVISQEAGGKNMSVSALLTIFKIAPINKAVTMPECKLNEYHKKCFDLFRNYLLNQKWLQLAGSPAYLSVTSDVHQIVPVNGSFDWCTNILVKNVMHHQGTPTFKIEKDGVYDIFTDVITNEPSQLTLFVNGTPDYSTTFGRDSGASRCLMRQFIKLNRGDVLTIRNFESHAGSINTSINSGGNLVGQNALFMAFLLSPNCEPPMYPPKKN